MSAIRVQDAVHACFIAAIHRSGSRQGHLGYLVWALRRLRTRGLRRKLAVPIATIREANLLRHSTALLVVQRPASAGFSSVLQHASFVELESLLKPPLSIGGANCNQTIAKNYLQLKHPAAPRTARTPRHFAEAALPALSRVRRPCCCANYSSRPRRRTPSYSHPRRARRVCR